jgi:hypothetical protein
MIYTLWTTVNKRQGMDEKSLSPKYRNGESDLEVNALYLLN